MAKIKYIGLVLFSSLLLLAGSVIYAGNVQAQSQATVTILPAIGGATSPDAGTTSYNDGTSVSISATATPGTGYTFNSWIILTNSGLRASTDNPLTFTATAGSNYTIQPVFNVITPINITSVQQNLANTAIVVILPAAGGTTVPLAGAYAFTNATAFNITAMPDNGWTFSHWVISGNTSVSHGGAPVNLEPTDNPYNINHGYGSTYYYQPVFTQSGASTSPGPSASIPEFPIFGVLLLLGAMVIPVVVLARKRRKQ
jgi:Divergent InlB B-repeat domain